MITEKLFPKRLSLIKQIKIQSTVSYLWFCPPVRVLLVLRVLLVRADMLGKVVWSFAVKIMKH